MPRIRTIKPEFWDSPSTAKASPWARLAFIAMWNWADDHGRGTANLKELEGFIFPNDTFPVRCSGNTVHFRDVVAEVSECFGVVLYEVGGRPFYAIPSWDRHQRNERRAKGSRHPAPPTLTSENAGSSGNTVHFRDGAAEIPRTSGPGTGEQGNRGTEKNHAHRGAHAPTERAGAHPDDQALAHHLDQAVAPTDTDSFTAFWATYPRKRAKGRAIKAWTTATRKAPPDVILTALQAQLPELIRRPPDKIPYPATWLNGESWTDELTVWRDTASHLGPWERLPDYTNPAATTARHAPQSHGKATVSDEQADPVPADPPTPERAAESLTGARAGVA